MSKKAINPNIYETIGRNIFIQMIMCICIISILLMVNLNNMYFHYINYDDIYNKCVGFLNNNLQFNIPLKNMNNVNTLVQEENVLIENAINKELIKEELIIEEIKEENVLINCNLMKSKADEIKQKYEFIVPTTGVVSCGFGNRVSSNNKISTFHLGVDIANSINTKINSATEGIVSDVSENSVYGKFIKIRLDNYIIIYAHCNKVLVEIGDSIKLGQNIALMGNTGLSTGTHLHFEIRDENNEVINPEYILDFNYEN